MSNPRRVIIVGLGGIGSWIAPAVGRILNTNAPESQLVLVDGDSFESKNAERQNFTKMGNKAKSIASDLVEYLDQTYVIPQPAWVVPKDQASTDDGVPNICAEDLLQEGDVLFTCVDNHAARKLLFEAAQNLDNVVVINGGNEDNGFGSTYAYIRRDGVDITDYPGIHHDEFVNPPDKNPGVLSCAERAELPSSTQIIATNMAVASYMAFDFRKIVFADEVDTERPDDYHLAAAVLTNEKFFELDYGQATTYARCTKDVYEKMKNINMDVASAAHGETLKLDDLILSQ